MGTNPADPALYARVKRRIYRKYPTHSAYRSGLLVQAYKRAFKGPRPYTGQRPSRTGLARWFKEDWKSDTGKYRYTSRSSVYRPTRRVTDKTPKTFKELGRKRIALAKRRKRTTGRATFSPSKKKTRTYI